MKSGGLQAARQEWIARQLGKSDPVGVWEDRDGKHYDYKEYGPGFIGTRLNWKPDPEEVASCCQRVSNKQLLYDHCRSANHVAHLYGVHGDDVYEARAAIEMMRKLNPEPPSSDALSGALAWIAKYERLSKAKQSKGTAEIIDEMSKIV